MIVMPEALIIAYGNPLCGDDGVGWEIAAAAAPDLPPGAVVITTHQLTPEYAEPISTAGLVIFVDAAEGDTPGTCSAFPVPPASTDPRAFTHQMDPDGLLTLAAALYGRRPPAYMLTVTGESFELSETLTPIVHSVVPTAAALLLSLVNSPIPSHLP